MQPASGPDRPADRVLDQEASRAGRPRRAAAKQRRETDLAEARQLGAALGLGTDASVTRVLLPLAPVSLQLTVVMVASLTVVTLILAIALAFSSGIAAPTLGVVTAGGVVATWLLARRTGAQAGTTRLFRYPAGLVQLHSAATEPSVRRGGRRAGRGRPVTGRLPA